MPKQATGEGTTEDMVRIGTIMAVPSILRGLGLNPLEVLSECGIDLATFDDPDNKISYTLQNRVLNYCAVRSNCEHFGLLVGQQAGLYSLGLVGLLMRYSPDVGTALRALVRYFHLHAHGPSLTLQVQGDTTIFGFQAPRMRAVTNNQLFDGAIVVMFNVLSELCRPGWKPIEACLLHSEPDDIAPYREFFHGRLRFNAGHNAIVFHSSNLRVNLPEARSDVRQLVQKQIDSLAAEHVDDLPEQVRTVLQAGLLTGNVSANHVAALFSMHPRTLNRHLDAYGIGYRDLVDEVRFNMAQQMLRDSRLDISEIALTLHYADSRSFIRAFRRWSGDTPARWRSARRLQRIASAR